MSTNVDIISELRNILNTYKISHRMMFMKADINYSKYTITYNSLQKAISNLAIPNNIHDQLSDIINIIIEQYQLCKDNLIYLSNLFKLIEHENENENRNKNVFVFVVPSYNNIDNYHINLDSIRLQTYESYLYRVIYIDDSSDDETYDKVKEYIKEHKLENQIDISIRPKFRQRQGLARYIAFHNCFDDEIVLNLDGDDWLYNEQVLQKMNNHYIIYDLYASYGSYYVYDSESSCVGIDKMMNYPYKHKLMGYYRYPKKIYDNKDYRNYPWIASHLRSAYAKLFKSIEIKHFVCHDGFFFKMASDQSEIVPCLRTSRK